MVSGIFFEDHSIEPEAKEERMYALIGVLAEARKMGIDIEALTSTVSQKIIKGEIEAPASLDEKTKEVEELKKALIEAYLAS